MDHNKTLWITTNCGKFFKRWKYRPPYLPPEKPVCKVKKQQLESDMEQDWFKTGQGVCQSCILSLCLFNFYAEYIMRNARLDKSQAEIKTAGISINNHRYADDSTLMAGSEKELKNLLMKMKEESEKKQA